MVICLAVGTLAGLSMACIVVYGRIQPIIATLATGAIYIGIALFLRPQPGGKIDEDLNWALTNALERFRLDRAHLRRWRGAWFAPFAWIPVPLRAPCPDRRFWSGCRSAARSPAAPSMRSARPKAPPICPASTIDRAKIAAFTLAGFFAGCGGLFLAIQTSSGNADMPQAGAYTLNSIAAVVIGGTSLLGGTGGAIGSIFGALILRVISFFFRIFDIAPLLQPLFEGIDPSGGGQHRRAARAARQEHAGAVQVTHDPGAPTLPRDDRPILIAALFILVDPGRRHRLYLAALRQRAAALADLSAAAIADRRLPRHRRRRDDARHPDRPDRPVGARGR